MKSCRPLDIKPINLCLSIMIVLSLSACSTDMSDLKQFVHDAKTKQQPKLPPLPEIKPHEIYRYSAGHLRNPFEPTISKRQETIKVKGKGKGPRPIEGRPQEVLEQYPLDSLRMVGTLTQQGTTWGLIKSNDGTVHRVKTGNYMGQNHGKIISINESQIELTEIVPDGLGDWMERPASLTLAKSPKGGR